MKTQAITVARARLMKLGLSAATTMVEPGQQVRGRGGVVGIYRGMLGSVVVVEWSAS